MALSNYLYEQFVEEPIRATKATGALTAEALLRGLGGFTGGMADIGEYLAGEPAETFRAGEKQYHELADWWLNLAQKYNPSMADKIVGGAVGGFVPGIGEFLLGPAWYGLKGATEAEKMGESQLMGAARGGTERYLLGKILGAMHPLQRHLRGLGFGGVGGLQAYLQGATPREILESAGTMGLYGLTGGPGRLGVPEVSREIELGKELLRRDVLRGTKRAGETLKKAGFAEPLKGYGYEGARGWTERPHIRPEERGKETLPGERLEDIYIDEVTGKITTNPEEIPPHRRRLLSEETGAFDPRDVEEGFRRAISRYAPYREYATKPGPKIEAEREARRATKEAAQKAEVPPEQIDYYRRVGKSLRAFSEKDRPFAIANIAKSLGIKPEKLIRAIDYAMKPLKSERGVIEVGKGENLASILRDAGFFEREIEAGVPKESIELAKKGYHFSGSKLVPMDMAAIAANRTRIRGELAERKQARKNLDDWIKNPNKEIGPDHISADEASRIFGFGDARSGTPAEIRDKIEYKITDLERSLAGKERQHRRWKATQKASPFKSEGGAVEEAPAKIAPKRKFWRAETGYTHEVGDTAADVVRYEQDELGNRLGVSEEIIRKLENRPATDIVWVGTTPESVKRYGTPEKIYLGKNPEVIARDGEGGLLVLKERSDLNE